MKDFKYDVDERVKEICAELKAERRHLHSSSDDEANAQDLTFKSAASKKSFSRDRAKSVMCKAGEGVEGGLLKKN